MIPLDHFLRATDAQLHASGTRTTFEAFAHDSRAVAAGDCFVAVRGVHRDGHEFLEEAADNGAAAVIIEQAWVTALEPGPANVLDRLAQRDVSVLVVPNVREALRRYTRHILSAWSPTVIAVTGATGKTTTKEAIAEVLATRAPTFRSWRNYNDTLGLPLSIGRLEPRHRFAVVEMGGDYPGEIAELCALVSPTVGVVTNVSPTHLQYFADVEELAASFASLPRCLSESGIAILNGDDARVRAMAPATRAQVRYYGLRGAADTPGEPVYEMLPVGEGGRSALTLRAAEGSEISFPHLLADHWGYTILAALAVARALGIEEHQALDALRALTPLPGRMRRLEGKNGLRLFDDTHNATPASTASGLRTAATLARAAKAPLIAVVGDMLRLGTVEDEAHRVLGPQIAADAGFLVTLGDRAGTFASEAQAAGWDSSRIAVTHTHEDAAAAVMSFARRLAREGAAPPFVYLKGSEEMRVERVTARLLADPEAAEDVLDRQTQAWQRVVVTRLDRPTWLEIDLRAIAENTRHITSLVGPDVRVLASLKADAYGHGAVRVARTVLRNGADWLGVATVSEAEALRDAGITAPILVFGYLPAWQAREAVRMDLRATVYQLELAQALSRAAQELGRTVRVHVKIDTGMARLGLRTEDVAGIVRFVRALRALDALEVEGVFTHFATADSADQTYARRQLDRFHRVLDALTAQGLRPPVVHAANSAAMLALPDARFDMVRPGIAIYGLNPSEEVRLPEGFRPALAFKTQVAQVKEIPAGEGISYGATYTTTRPTRIAVLPVGYADGFRRAPNTWGEVLVHGERAPILGRVCMDQCMVDVTSIPHVRQGDEVVLIGRQGQDAITAEEVARNLGTIAYEVVSELLARVPRIS